jgi:predicted esterase
MNRFLVTALIALMLGSAACAAETTDNAEESDAEETGSTGQALSSNASVYTNTALASGWQSWSWSTTASFANTDAPLASGSTSHIKATMSSSSGALSLAHSAADLSTADYDSITFDVRATTSSTIRLGLQTLGGTSSGSQASVPVTTTWTRQTVKLSTVQGSLTKFGKVNFIATYSGQTIYVDNVTLVAKTTTSSSYPTAPLTVSKGTVVTLNSSASPYSMYVPYSYDATHKTPTKLLIWMHGCGGNAYGDAWATSPGGTQSWVSVSVGGRDGVCWDPNVDVPKVIAALDDVKRRLNIDPHRVIIGGYSSGGDLAYRTAFYNASRFAGLLAENTSPFRDTGSSQSASLAAATRKFNVVHLAHLSDTTYPIAGVRTETDALAAAGFPMKRIERAGTHFDPDTSSSGTKYDMRTYLLPYIDAGWVSP